MGEIFVIAEHREKELREITFQMLHKADELCRELSHELTAVVIGGKDMPFVNDIAERADRVILMEDDGLRDFNGDIYKEIINRLIAEHRPFLTLMGHTPWGMDLGPALAVKTGFPTASDCVDILVENDNLRVIRQIYSGKLFSKVSFRQSESYIITVRPGAFSDEKAGERNGEIVRADMPADLPEARGQFVEFVDAGAGEVDISQAEFLVSIGRGVGEEENIVPVKELTERMGGVLSCSRPIVDKNWLPKYHQVGTSGKTVKPRVYLALGISGAFQHVAGIGGAGTVIAVNKDKKAPIFRVADYGVADDLFKIVDALKEKLAE
ncbi:MAG: electron transfer flavoprotein subunit alpha/FixB family protein [Deltaproteobacteria bacterium]|nr:electron transfer flavoprotein subunit alpha/FixB family protein [Deltaproteobacteria bacterium]